MERYIEYKDSGVDWLGEIPVGWKIKKLKFLGKLFNGDSLNEKQKNKFESNDVTHNAYISSKDIDAELSSINYNNGLRIPNGVGKYKLAPKGSSLLCIEGGSAGKKIALTNQNVCFVNKLACIEPGKQVYSKYVFYSLKSSPFQEQFKLSMTGLIGGVAISSIKNFELTFPPLLEQKAIADFLYNKTTKIDELVGIKRQQIALLAERKQILIQNAVTKGLNPDAPMKDSGVDWIGDIPAHWKTTKLRYLGTFQNGISAGAEYFGSGYPFVTYGDVYNNSILPSKPSGFAKSSTADRINYSILKGDVLFTRTSEVANDIGISSTCLKTIENATFSGFLIRMRPRQNALIPKFSKYLFRCSYISDFFAHEMNLVIRASLGQELLKNLPIFLPPLDEQEELIEKIDTISIRIDELITVTEEQITKLNEYKTTLINAAVTGKIKVA